MKKNIKITVRFYDDKDNKEKISINRFIKINKKIKVKRKNKN